MAEPEPKFDAMGASSPSQTFAGGAETIRDARDFVREKLVDTHVDLDRAVLLTSELATNAVVHAHSEYVVTIRRSTGSIRVELDNRASEPLPQFQEPSDGGRGFRLVEAMAARWGTESEPHHKLVWFELPDPE